MSTTYEEQFNDKMDALGRAINQKAGTPNAKTIEQLTNVVNSLQVQSGSSIIYCSTDEQMAAALTNDNIGRLVLFTGTTSENYENGTYYLIEDN